MITLETLNTVHGHATVYIEETEPQKRADLAKTVEDLLQQGHAVMLVDGDYCRRIKSYDAEANEWVVLATAQEKSAGMKAARKSGRASNAVVVGRTAGG